MIDVVKPVDLLPDELKISPDSPTILTTLAPMNIPLSLLPSQVDVQEVALLVDGVRVAQTATPAKSLRLGTLRPGAYELSLETTDSSGAIRLSAPMMLLVQPELTPGILEAESVTGGVELRIQTIAGEKCWVESATSLDPENWKTEETLTGDGKVRRQKVPLSDGKARFFRVRMQ